MNSNIIVSEGVYNNVYYKIEKNGNDFYNCFAEIPEQFLFKNLIKTTNFKKCFQGITALTSKQMIYPTDSQPTEFEFLVWQLPITYSLSELSNLLLNVIDQLFGDNNNV